MPEVFGVRGVTFWQALRLLLLAGLLAGPGCVSLRVGGKALADERPARQSPAEAERDNALRKPGATAATGDPVPGSGACG